MIATHSLHLLACQRQCLLIPPESAESLNFRRDGHGWICRSVCLVGKLDCFIERPEGLIIFVKFNQTCAVHACVSNASARIGGLGNHPCLDHFLLRCRDVAEKKCCNSLLANCSGRKQVMVLAERQSFHLFPGLPRHSRVVVHFEHPEDCQNANPCLRLMRFRQCKVTCQQRDLGRDASRGFAVCRHFADTRVKRFRELMFFCELNFCLPVDRTSV